jgi:hypothetical protein
MSKNNDETQKALIERARNAIGDDAFAVLTDFANEIRQLNSRVLALEMKLEAHAEAKPTH